MQTLLAYIGKDHDSVKSEGPFDHAVRYQWSSDQDLTVLI
jgi:hypothetical protein